MTRRLDIDIADRILAGPETAGRRFAEMALRCVCCGDQAACRKLQEDNPRLDAAPSFCMNKDMLRR